MTLSKAFGVRISLYWLALVQFFYITAQASPPLPFMVQKEYYNCVSPEGFLHLWREIVPVKVSGIELPLIFDFASERKESSPYLGPNWSCSLLESRAVEFHTGGARVTLPTGIRIGFKLENGVYKQQGMTFTSDGKPFTWEASGSIQDSFTLKGPQNWKLFYEQGVLAKMQTGDGLMISLEIKDKRVQAILDENGKRQVDIEYDKDGRPRSWKINDKTITLQFQDGRLAGIVGPSIEETYAYGDNERFHYLLLRRVEGGSPTFSTYKWNTANQIISDGQYEYTIGVTNEHTRLPKITRVAMSGDEDSIKFDPATGVMEIKSPDGTTSKTYTVLKGANFGTSRKIEQIDTNGEVSVVYRAESDENCKTVRTTTAQTDPAGKSITDPVQDVLSHYKTDENGRVLARMDAKSNLWTYEYDDRGNRSGISLNGKLVWTNTVPKTTNVSP